MNIKKVLRPKGITLLVTLGCIVLGVVPAVADERLEGIDEYINNSLEDWRLPGIAVAVVENGKVLLARGYGVKELGKDARNDADTLFQIGSTSKAFAAASIAVLVDDGKLTWDDRIVDHLPWFNVENPEILEKATIRDLLTHMSGITGVIGPFVTIMSSDEAARQLEYAGPMLPFRGQFSYSNAGYGLIEHIVEAVSGMSWQNFVEQHIFAPLGMNDSATSPYDIWKYPFVAPTFWGSAPAGNVSIENAPDFNVALPNGYDRCGKRRVMAWQSYENTAPAGNVVSSVNDMAKWLQMFLCEGTYDGKAVIQSNSVREMISPLVDLPGYFLFADNNSAHYGMGWREQAFQGHRLVFHGGGIFGFPAFVAFLPEEKLGVVVLANGSTLTPYYPHQEIVAWVTERVLGLEFRDWHGEVLAATNALWDRVSQRETTLQAEREKDTIPTLPLKEYAGKYEHDLIGLAKVKFKKDELYFQIDKKGAFSGLLEHWQDDQFRLHFDGGDGAKYANALVTFEVNETGKVLSLTGGMLGSFTRVQ